jgi:hypothetical protein
MKGQARVYAPGSAVDETNISPCLIFSYVSARIFCCDAVTLTAVMELSKRNLPQSLCHKSQCGGRFQMTGGGNIRLPSLSFRPQPKPCLWRKIDIDLSPHPATIRVFTVNLCHTVMTEGAFMPI